MGSDIRTPRPAMLRSSSDVRQTPRPLHASGQPPPGEASAAQELRSMAHLRMSLLAGAIVRDLIAILLAGAEPIATTVIFATKSLHLN